MNERAFSDLTLSLSQALEHAQGKRSDLRTTEVPAPPEPLSKEDIIAIRELFRCSQAIFAATLNVSVKTIQAWEQGQRVPSDAALKLLTVARNHPEVLLEDIKAA